MRGSLDSRSYRAKYWIPMDAGACGAGHCCAATAGCAAGSDVGERGFDSEGQVS
jgi:hypothetical protein